MNKKENEKENVVTWIRFEEAAKLGGFPSKAAARKWIYRWNKSPGSPLIRRRHGALIKEDLIAALLQAASTRHVQLDLLELLPFN